MSAWRMRIGNTRGTVATSIYDVLVAATQATSLRHHPMH
jgi:hypothetical protein